jgi:hypothetical protein
MRTLALLLLAALALAGDSLFQYRIDTPVPDKGGERQARVLCWIPPAAERLRGALLCGQVLVEGDVVRDRQVRAACAEQALAVIHVSANLGQIDFPRLMRDLAAATGYAELAEAPVIPFGHSAGGGPALALAQAHPARAIGVVQYRGGMPDENCTLPQGTPTLAMMGQFDEHWDGMRDAEGRESWERAQAWIGRFRAAAPGNLGAFVAEPGAGHFAWSEANASLLAQWIRSVAARRIPADGGALVPLDPASGWLLPFALRKAEVAAYADYTGDRAQASWLPDEATARLAAAYHAPLGQGLADQFIAWKDATWVDAGVRFFFTQPTWSGDGATVLTHPVFRADVPGRIEGKGPIWPDAGKPVGNGGTPITVAVAAGAAVAGPGPHEITLALDAVYDDPTTRITFIARAPAGGGHRATELIGMMPRGFKGLTGGAAQSIAFTAPEQHALGAGPLPLQASSDSGLPVALHVAHGPARIVDGKLVIDQMPARAVLPLEVRIVASQMGRGTAPQVRMAAPVARTIRIVR